MLKQLFTVILFLNIYSLQAQDNKMYEAWKIGEFDNSYSEFALSNNGYGNFVKEGFGGSNRYFVVGKSSSTNDFPYVLPGPKDEFAGYGYWAGLALNKLPIYFDISNLPKEGNCKLTISFYGVSSEKAPLFRSSVNGCFHDYQLKTNSSKNKLESLKNTTQKIEINIPVEELKEGINEIYFQNMSGNWCVFDAISFRTPKDLKIKTPGNTLVKSVQFATHEYRKKEIETLALQVDILHKGNNVIVKAVVDSLVQTLTLEEGHSVLEFQFPTVKDTVKSKVSIFVHDTLVYNSVLTRTPKSAVQLSDYVNQFMGTSGSRWMIAPGPWMPMGMVKIAPDNENSGWKAGYEYQIENIMGFSHIHEWTMAGLLMMPTNGKLQIKPGNAKNPDSGYRSRINKKTEVAEIGYYKTDLLDYNIKAELAATTRASIQRYTFPEAKENRVLIDLFFPSEYKWELRDAKITKVSNTEIEGWAKSYCNTTGYSGEQDYTLHFVIKFSEPFKKMGGWINDNIVYDETVIERKHRWYSKFNKKPIGDVGAFVNFQKGTKTVTIRTGISLVSTSQARLNLEKEIVEPFGWDFEKVVKNQKNTWNNIFSRVEIETDDCLQKVKFYTNFYRALSPRNTWSDVNGKWVDMNENIQQTDPSKPIYGSDGFWGWHWNLVQLYNLVMPEYSSNWINTFLEMYDKGGWLPIGNPGMEYFRVMIGQPAIPLIVSAYQHGIRDFDVEKMYQAMLHQQTSMMEKYSGGGEVGNESYNYYLDKGFVPLNKFKQSYVSNTMEYAYQDWCFAQFAKALNKTDTYNVFQKRSENWRNIFDKSTGFVRPKNIDGSWLKDFDPYHSPGFCESNSWQYTWYVPQNVDGLIDAIGKEEFISRLDSAMKKSEKVYFNALGDNFSKYPINHGNESNMQASYLFNYADKPNLTQKWTRAIQEKYYGLGVRDAYPGDEDQGQMSAWYVMSAIGLFQMDGGTSTDPYYELGSPRFKKVTIHLSDKYYGGKTFVIEAKNASRNNKYIKSATLNDKELNTWKIPQKEIIKGGTLIIEMGDE